MEVGLGCYFIKDDMAVLKYDPKIFDTLPTES